jgi:hypothetical protein
MEKTNTCNPLLAALSTDEIDIFREIFVNNNVNLRHSFFTNPLVKKIWPIVIKNMTYSDMFKKQPKENLYATYCKVSEIVIYEFQLGLPSEWST